MCLILLCSSRVCLESFLLMFSLNLVSVGIAVLYHLIASHHNSLAASLRVPMPSSDNG